VELHEHGANQMIVGKTIRKYQFEFHVRHYLSERIHYEIINDDDASWPASPSNVAPRQTSLRAKMQAIGLKAMRRLFSQRKHNSMLDVVSLLRCPECREGGLSMEEGRLRCGKCEASYQVVNDISRLFPGTKGGIGES
jgi:hypothetical protein